MNLHLGHMMKIIMQMIFLFVYHLICLFINKLLNRLHRSGLLPTECTPYKGDSPPVQYTYVHEACGLPEVGTTCIVT
jgi:hypothetical protein